METFFPLELDISNTDVVSLFDDGNSLWIGSSDFVSSKGVSWINPRSNESFVYEFEGTINMNPTPVYSIHVSDGELWVGGKEIILVYDMKDDYWRTLGEERGVPSGVIWDVHGDSSHIWIASSVKGGTASFRSLISVK